MSVNDILKIFRYIGVVVAILAVFVWVYAFYKGSFTTKPATFTAPVVKVTLPTIPAASTTPVAHNGNVIIQGKILLDTSNYTDQIPYLQYSDGQHNFITKQLIFANTRGCSTYAGDLPCVGGTGSDSAYPELKTGQEVSVEGVLKDDRIFVYSLTVL